MVLDGRRADWAVEDERERMAPQLLVHLPLPFQPLNLNMSMRLTFKGDKVRAQIYAEITSHILTICPSHSPRKRRRSAPIATMMARIEAKAHRPGGARASGMATIAQSLMQRM